MSLEFEGIRIARRFVLIKDVNLDQKGHNYHMVGG